MTDSKHYPPTHGHETASGIALMLASVVAVICANTPLEQYYNLILSTIAEVRIGAFSIGKPLLLWINDGLMAVFFFVVGLELKREVIEGELSDRRRIMLPGAGAIGGMLVPALIYAYVNHGDPTAMQGWAIPAATDIAFALGILSLLGPRVPPSIRIFLASLAIFDDIGAIVIIALFYTSNITATALIMAALCIVALAAMNRSGIASRSMYLGIGLVMWVSLLKSGVHATLAGVMLAMFIPLRPRSGAGSSMLREMEGDLRLPVSFFILPLFAFANSGINIRGLGIEQVLHGVPFGIALGLFIGKQAGVFVFCWLGVRLGIATLPKGVSWGALYGAALLCGIGFTMSMFIGSLAFEETHCDLCFDERLGIIIGSLASGLAGYGVLRWSLRKAGNV